MSLKATPEMVIKYGENMTPELRAEGYVGSLCFAIEAVLDERQLDQLRRGVCNIHVTREQLDQLKTIVNDIA